MTNKLGGLTSGLSKLVQGAEKDAGKAANVVKKAATSATQAAETAAGAAERAVTRPAKLLADGFEGVARGAVHVVQTAESVMQPYGPAGLLPPPGIGLNTNDQQLSAQLDRYTQSRLTQGNQVQVYVDGQNALPHVLGAIDSAQKSICYETYQFDGKGTAPDEVVTHLIAAKQRGVDVRVSADAIGSREFLTSHNAELQRLRDAGIPVEIYNPVKGLSALDVHRDHRKSIVIDGQTAFVGGMNTGDRYFGGPDVPKRFHDVFTQLQGPAVGDVLNDFLDVWKSEGGGAVDPASLVGPKPAALGGAPVSMRVVEHTPGQDANIRAAYLALINHATQDINVENSYPMSQDLVDALSAAAQRGVKVNYIYGAHEGMLGIDARKSFEQLLDAGVHIYVYPTPIHTKSMSVDGTYCTVGSSNVDNVALTRNREIITLAQDPAYTANWDAQLFQKDLVGTPDGRKTLELHRPLSDPLWQKLGDAIIAKLWPDTLE